MRFPIIPLVLLALAIIAPGVDATSKLPPGKTAFGEDIIGYIDGVPYGKSETVGRGGIA